MATPCHAWPGTSVSREASDWPGVICTALSLAEGLRCLDLCERRIILIQPTLRPGASGHQGHGQVLELLIGQIRPSYWLLMVTWSDTCPASSHDHSHYYSGSTYGKMPATDKKLYFPLTQDRLLAPFTDIFSPIIKFWDQWWQSWRGLLSWNPIPVSRAREKLHCLCHSGLGRSEPRMSSRNVILMWTWTMRKSILQNLSLMTGVSQQSSSSSLLTQETRPVLVLTMIQDSDNYFAVNISQPCIWWPESAWASRDLGSYKLTDPWLNIWIQTHDTWHSVLSWQKHTNNQTRSQSWPLTNETNTE